MIARIVIVLLSGKGGSGKTVLALSMSRVLTEAGLKVLLVDCDASTHGATYFFESELEDRSGGGIANLADFAIGVEKDHDAIQTKLGFDFIPSTVDPSDPQSVALLASMNGASFAIDSLNRLPRAY